jgi:hypothetical protein
MLRVSNRHRMESLDYVVDNHSTIGHQELLKVIETTPKRILLEQFMRLNNSQHPQVTELATAISKQLFESYGHNSKQIRCIFDGMIELIKSTRSAELMDHLSRLISPEASWLVSVTGSEVYELHLHNCALGKELGPLSTNIRPLRTSIKQPSEITEQLFLAAVAKKKLDLVQTLLNTHPAQVCWPKNSSFAHHLYPELSEQGRSIFFETTEFIDTITDRLCERADMNDALWLLKKLVHHGTKVRHENAVLRHIREISEPKDQRIMVPAAFHLLQRYHDERLLKQLICMPGRKKKHRERLMKQLLASIMGFAHDSEQVNMMVCIRDKDIDLDCAAGLNIQHQVALLALKQADRQNTVKRQLMKKSDPNLLLRIAKIEPCLFTDHELTTLVARIIKNPTTIILDSCLKLKLCRDLEKLLATPCPITREAIDTSKAALSLCCLALFDTTALITWMEQTSSCPACRNDPLQHLPILTLFKKVGCTPRLSTHEDTHREDQAHALG